MRSLILFLLLVSAGATFAQTPDTVTLTHKYYSTTFSKSKHFPVVVKYWVTKNMLNCKKRFPRPNNFRPDPLLPKETNLKKDYAGSGYDQGHNMDAYDNGCDAVGMSESFYYSNMCPQTPTLNRGEWKSLEEYTRNQVETNDSVLVWCGSVALKNKKHIGKVTVPDYCWKIIFIKKIGTTEAYSFKNDKSQPKHIESYKVSVDSVQNLSGLRFAVD
jgi:endonuclease G